MPKSILQRLEKTLEDLTEDELRKFKTNLHEFPVKPGYDNIPRGQLQKADVLDLSELLLDSYTQDYAVEVTAAVLRRCHCNPQAEKLAAASGIGNQPSSSSHRHFIDQFREQLIQRTATVEQVLDKLLHKSIVNEEQYQKICSQETNQDKMRKLYKLVPSWNDQCKDQLKNALKDVNPCLIKDLEGE
ncbi:apoptosis-associated speck-like protein containing a CARD isoform X2 [Pseudonaja textilis]|uniref:apoptosis-associated speck-like protein containing a CARD isoform X2 n=1 Tax=Pseudonaja textilis TaxID=8673 RepID=UPI000EA99B78|nr:apoptosis-associated speck-like protein containing a CARD isoform X2 [Pseudonaja textilis]